MNSFKIRLLAASIAALASTGAAAQSYTYQVISTPESVRDMYGVDINDQGLVLLNARTPRNAELDFNYIPDGLKAVSGIPLDFDPTTDSLSYFQYNNVIARLADKVNPDSKVLRIATSFAASFDGQSVTMPALLNTEGNGASSQLNSADHEFLGMNQNNVRVGTGTAPYVRYVHEYTPEPAEGEEPETKTLNYAQREFTSRGIWHDGVNTVLIEPVEQAVLGGEAALFDINDTNMAAGFMSVAVNPRGQERIDECAELEGDTTANITAYNCTWNAWHSFQREPAANLSSYSGSVLKNGSIYDMQATIWQLDAQGAVISYETYPALMERVEDDTQEMSSYAYAINNNGIAVGQSWTYWSDEARVGTRVKMPAIYMNGETSPVTVDEDYLWGAALDINDNNLAIGFVLKSFQGTRRAVPFIYDVDAAEFSELPSFFVGSSTFPNAINNADIIVGSAEIDSSLNATRRKVGFLYDLNNPEQGVINLNDAIGCPAEYFIVSAEAINEQNQIVATALTTQEYIDAEGTAHDENVPVTLVLNEGDLDFSGPRCSDEQYKVERQGASVSPLSLIAMLLIGGLITVRRKIKI